MFKVIIPKATFKELEKLDSDNQQLVYTKILDLEKGIFTADKALKGKHKGKFRKRAGNYRIVYSIESNCLVIEVVRVGHRKDVYRNIT